VVLPAGWEAQQSRADGATYYVNLLNEEEATWTLPTMPAQPAKPPATEDLPGVTGWSTIRSLETQDAADVRVVAQRVVVAQRQTRAVTQAAEERAQARARVLAAEARGKELEIAAAVEVALAEAEVSKRDSISVAGDAVWNQSPREREHESMHELDRTHVQQLKKEEKGQAVADAEAAEDAEAAKMDEISFRPKSKLLQPGPLVDYSMQLTAQVEQLNVRAKIDLSSPVATSSTAGVEKLRHMIASKNSRSFVDVNVPPSSSSLSDLYTQQSRDARQKAAAENLRRTSFSQAVRALDPKAEKDAKAEPVFLTAREEPEQAETSSQATVSTLSPMVEKFYEGLVGGRGTESMLSTRKPSPTPTELISSGHKLPRVSRGPRPKVNTMDEDPMKKSVVAGDEMESVEVPMKESVVAGDKMESVEVPMKESVVAGDEMESAEVTMKESVVAGDKMESAAAYTVWVGGIPDTSSNESALLTAFSGVGKVMSVTVRHKEGDLKNWAFITFADAAGMTAALVSDTRVSGDDGEVLLSVKKAEPEKELQKLGTGALSEIWADQEQKIKNDEDASDMLDAAFKSMDADGSGTLDHEEMWALLGGSCSKAQMESVIRELDADGTGLIDVNEFKDYLGGRAGKLSAYAEDMHILENAFNLIDTDASGMLDRDEMWRLMSLMGNPCNDTEMDSLMDELDADGGGLVDINEFKDYWSEKSAELSKFAENTRTLQEAFASIDTDGSGFLDRSEVEKLLRLMGKPCSKTELDGIMSELDADGDGAVNFVEFQIYWGERGGEFSEFGKKVHVHMLREAFISIDTDGSGALDRDEVRRLLLMMGKRCNTTELDTIMFELDTDGSGSVDIEEFQNYWSGNEDLTKFAESMRKLQEAFASIDTDGSGFLDRSEVEKLLRLMGKPCSKTELDGIMSELDADGDGAVNFVEFQIYWGERGGVSKFTENMRMLEDAFKSIDTDGSGFLDPSEVKKLMQLMGKHYDRSELNKIMSELDPDGDGFVDFDEFKDCK
jgi:Ca2+-binding EF-hand superfamily protein